RYYLFAAHPHVHAGRPLGPPTDAQPNPTRREAHESGNPVRRLRPLRAGVGGPLRPVARLPPVPRRSLRAAGPALGHVPDIPPREDGEPATRADAPRSLGRGGPVARSRPAFALGRARPHDCPRGRLAVSPGLPPPPSPTLP